jgi:hypothetical protein
MKRRLMPLFSVTQARVLGQSHFGVFARMNDLNACC